MKRCPDCGIEKELFEYDHYFDKTRNKLRPQAACKTCYPERNRKNALRYYALNQETEKLKRKEYRKNNADKIKADRPKYKKRQIEKLQNWYVKELLITRNNVSKELIEEVPEIIEAKRASLKLKRTIKSKKNEK